MDDKCAKCGGDIGNNVFTVCDDCWDDEHKITQLETENSVFAEQNLAMNDTTVKQYHRIEQLEEAMKKIFDITDTGDVTEPWIRQKIYDIAQKVLEDQRWKRIIR